MKLLWILLMKQLAWTSVWAQYHELSAKIFGPPSKTLRNNSLFGYSFDYQPDIRRMAISAPREDDIGNIYSCDIDTRNCSTIKKYISRQSKDYTHDYWLGATVKAGRDYFVTCAPRNVDGVVMADGSQDFAGFSLCYMSKKGTELSPIGQISDADRYREKTRFEEMFDSFGWSIDISDKDDIVIGGPAMYTGRVMKKKKAIVYTSGIDKNIKYNFGYSVAVGNFFNNDIMYAVSSPYGNDGHGKVVFLNEDFATLSSKIVDESHVGALFGAALATARISGKGTDLLVGAPAFATQHSYNLGAVYFYQTYGKVRHSTIKCVRVIAGQKEGSFFGSAITSVGDLNGDRRDEVAIGAPFEDGHGVVYLYCGTVFLINTDATSAQFMQRIRPEEKYHMFGLSLSALSDYDENGCNELAIGAPENNTVVLYRCMASVIIDVKAKFPNLQNRGNVTHPYPDRNQTYFNFQSCINVIYPKKLKTITADIQVKVEITHSIASLANPAEDGVYEVSLHKKNPQYCKDIGVNLPLNGNYNTKIFYNIQASLLNSPVSYKEFDASRVVLSDRSTLACTGSVWAAECKEVNHCMPKLDLKMEVLPAGTFLIGTRDFMELKLIVENTGEVAYDSCVIVKLEGTTILSAAKSLCTHMEQNQLKCGPSNALQTKATWSTEGIMLHTKSLTNMNKFIKIQASLYDDCTGLKGEKVYNETVILKPMSNMIAVKGETNIGEVIAMTTPDVATGKMFEHSYKITNNGPTNWVEVPCELRLPKLPYLNYSGKYVTVYEDQKTGYGCKIDEETVSDAIIVSCILSRLDSKGVLLIVVAIEIPPKTLENILNEQNVTVATNLSLDFDGDVKKHSIETLVMLRDITVPWWIILVATIVGLLILLIIACILYQFGFLRRNNKKKLEQLRKSVRRQTIRRSMMQNQVEDRQRLTGLPVEAGEIAGPCSEPTGIKNRIEISDAQIQSES